MSILALAIGCVSPGGSAPASLCDPATCVDLTDAPPDWALRDGYDVYDVVVVPDLTGDGRPDAWVSLWEPVGDTSSMLVEGPLARTLSLPEDAWTELPLGVTPVGDATGDGRADLRWGVQLWAGPVPPGPFDPPAPDVDVGAVLADLDDDGVLDAVVSERAGRVWVWPGPVGASVGPSLTLVTSCPSLLDVDVVPDLDADGFAELVLRDPDRACQSTLVSTGRLGTVDLDRDPRVWRGARTPWVVGDQDGDGWRDVIDGDVLATGPFTVSADGLVPAATVALDPVRLAEAPRRVPVDFDGDGLGEWVVRRDSPRPPGRAWDVTVDVWRGGVDGGLAGAEPFGRFGVTGWATSFSFGVDDGRALLWVAGSGSSGVVVHDLGAATPLAHAD